MEKNLMNFLDADGKLKVFPSKQKDRLMVLKHLATRFESGRRYTEFEVNDIIDRAHAFQDRCLLRRELYNNHLLGRERNGSAYWLEEEQE